MTLRRRGEVLELQVPGQPAFALEHDDAGDFYPVAFDALLTPQRRQPAASQEKASPEDTAEPPPPATDGTRGEQVGNGPFVDDREPRLLAQKTSD